MALDERFQKVLQDIRRNDESFIKIAVIGQPGAGKSSIINALMGRKVAETGARTDTTTVVTDYDYDKFIKFGDFPGYGTEKITYDTWMQCFHPESYDVFIYVFSGKFNVEDERLFTDLNQWSSDKGKSFFLVRNVSENLTDKECEAIIEDVKKRDKIGRDVRQWLLFVSYRTKKGIDALKERIKNIDVQKVRRDRIIRTFGEKKESWLRHSRAQADDTVTGHSLGAAVNGINPIPGTDIAVDVGIYLSMFSSVRDCYDIEEADFKKYLAIPIAKKLLELLTKEGILLFLKNFVGRQTVKTVSKYIPIVGQVVAAGVGLTMAMSAGDSYNGDCYRFAEDVMDRNIAEEIKRIMA